MTKNAAIILDMIQNSDSHLTAEQVYLQLKSRNSKLVLATVYNNLNLLYKEGLINKVSIEGYPDRFDKATKHDHLVCKYCGKLSDICLNDLTDQLKAQLDVPILDYDLKVHYICPDCKGQQSAPGHQPETR
ncbi:Fe2+ or Zn2+ uptake regulation protein [Anaerotaenia torta]|uniref:Fur family transcriptional regulator n=1 Tax=Anaerotaenia torta TaxID=433293 RepID=UPI003D222F4D